MEYIMNIKCLVFYLKKILSAKYEYLGGVKDSIKNYNNDN